MLLVGDIGGTKTHLAVFSPEHGPRVPLVEAKFLSSDYPSLEAVVQAFLTQVDGSVDRACFGVAGPVIHGQATVTNLPWRIEEATLKREFQLSSAHLLNDLEAIAHALPILDASDLHTINVGEPVQGGALAVIAPGTGLGEAFLTWDGSQYQAHTSEGGHADFAPTTKLELDLLWFLLDRFDHVSYERVCSGIGLPNIYAFLKGRDATEEPPWLAQELALADDPTPIIVNAALEGKPGSQLCMVTLTLFASILAAEAGNLALKMLATGGIFLGGGIPPRILPYLESQGFLQAFYRKGRLTDLLTHIPVQVILNPQSGLMGAAFYGLNM